MRGVAHDVDRIDERFADRRERALAVACCVTLAYRGDVVREAGALEVARVRVDDRVREQIAPSGVDAVGSLRDREVDVGVDRGRARRATRLRLAGSDLFDRPRDM